MISRTAWPRISGIMLCSALPVLAVAGSGGGVALGPSPPVDAGLAWLEANQNTGGSWGSVLQGTASAAVLETLTTLDPCRPSVAAGASWLAGEAAENSESLAREAGGLGWAPGFEQTARSRALDLLARRNAATTNTALPNWPEGGWGVAPGYETDSLTTALAMLALESTGFSGGFTATSVALAGGATQLHTWFIPGDALKARILITVSGSTVRLRMKQGSPPTALDPYFPLAPGGPYLIVFPDSGLPFTPGTNYISVQSPSPPATPASYTMTASYETPSFDTRSLAEPLAYLREAQSLDGGWGLQRGQPSDLYTTLHALLALQRYASYEFGPEIADGVLYVKTQQLGGGAFGYGGQPIAYVTALAGLCLVRAESPAFSTPTQNAITALTSMQTPGGSWDQEPYDTALAMLAIWEHGVPPVAEAGADRTVTDTNGNCVETVTLSGSGSDANGTVVSYVWADGCTQVATGASPAVSLPVGSHALLLTVTDNGGYTGRDRVRVTVLDGGINADGDLFTSCFDCNDANNQIWGTPGEVPDLDFLTADTLSWTAPPDQGGVFVAYDLLRSTMPSNFVSGTTCVESDDGSDTQAMDTASPPAETVFLYLPRAQNGCPAGQGSLGQTSAGVPRVGRSCP